MKTYLLLKADNDLAARRLLFPLGLRRSQYTYNPATKLVHGTQAAWERLLADYPLHECPYCHLLHPQGDPLFHYVDYAVNLPELPQPEHSPSPPCDTLQHLSVQLPAEIMEYIRTVGNGNASAGIRRIINDYMHTHPPLPTAA